jgi:hypothetical protein
MKKIFIVLMFVLIFFLLFIGCSENQKSSTLPVVSTQPEAKTQQRSISILKMSDLEIIKKSADYLKSCGKSLVFEETKILYENNLELSPICKDRDNQDVLYSGDYLIIYFYPHAQLQEQENILIVYMGEEGKILGFREEKNSQG